MTDEIIPLRPGIQEKLDEYLTNKNHDIFDIIFKTINKVYEENSKDKEIKLPHDMASALVRMYLNGVCRIGDTEEVDPNKIHEFEDIRECDLILNYAIYDLLNYIFSL